MNYAEIIDVIEENREKLIEEMYELDKAQYKYQIDLYLYPDGSTYQFDNPGGNSWSNDDHFVLWTCNNEFSEHTEGEFPELEDTREYYDNILSAAIEKCEWRIRQED